MDDNCNVTRADNSLKIKLQIQYNYNQNCKIIVLSLNEPILNILWKLQNLTMSKRVLKRKESQRGT